MTNKNLMERLKTFKGGLQGLALSLILFIGPILLGNSLDYLKMSFSGYKTQFSLEGCYGIAKDGIGELRKGCGFTRKYFYDINKDNQYDLMLQTSILGCSKEYFISEFPMEFQKIQELRDKIK